MPSAVAKKSTPWYGPRSNGIVMTPWEFDRAQFLRGYRYELINGVLIVSPSPLENERDPNEELGHWLRTYKEGHAKGGCLDATLPEQTIRTGANRRKADRCIWVGLGRLPRASDVPSVVAEFVSKGKRNAMRDYEIKRDEYLTFGVKEYWVFDRFKKTLTVFQLSGQRLRKRVFSADDTYSTPLLPGFKLTLAKLFTLANQWQPVDEEEEL